MTQPSVRTGFTILELVIVLSIILILAGLLTSMMGIARRQGMRTNTEATMRKVAAAIRMFQRDNGVLPYQARYPVTGMTTSVLRAPGYNDYPDSVSKTEPFPNILFRRLGRTMTQAEQDVFNSAAAAAGNKYQFYARLRSTSAAQVETGSVLAYRESYLLPAAQGVNQIGDANVNTRLSSYINRSAMDRSRRAVYAGALDLDGQLIAGPTSATPFLDLTSTPLLSSSEIGSMTTGWCDDYLEGSLRPQDAKGDAVVDAYGNPLIYVGMVIPRTRSVSALVYNTEIKSKDLTWYGLGATGFRANTGPWADVVAARRWRLLQNGRITVGADAVDNLPAPVCATNPGAALDSDRRYFAAPGLELDFELWSAGPDGAFAWRRSDPLNKDNIPLQPYDRALQ